jgi:ABC-type multidrug transport system fused ATPase/permease subunit
MKESGGSAIRINGSIAYAGQKPWIFNATVKENILFGSALDQQRYNDVIHYSCLKADLEVLPEGNETVIG